MTVLHTGSTKKFVSGWEAIFSGRKSGRASVAKTALKPTKRSAPKKPKAAAAKAGKKRSS